MPSIEETRAALEAANGRYQEARLEGQRLSLSLLAMAAREVFPNAPAIILAQSDQGDFADIEMVEVPRTIDTERCMERGEHVLTQRHPRNVCPAEQDENQETFRDEYTDIAWNLDTSGWTEWQIFCDPGHNARWQWRLLINPVLQYGGDFQRRLADLTAAAEATR